MRNFQLLKSAPFQSLVLRNSIGVNFSSKHFFSTSTKLFKENDSAPDPNHPLRRTFNLIGRDFKSIKEYFKSSSSKLEESTVPDEEANEEDNQPITEFQTHCDVLIIGGGAIGSSISYWLKEKARRGLNVVVVEKDPTYRKFFDVKSYHGLHMNFSLPENIQMAKCGYEFLRNVKYHLGDVNLNFTPYGTLRLASEENSTELQEMSKIQNEMGVRNELLTPEKIKSKFPWINTDGIVLGSHGLEGEGWFDPLALLFGYKNKAIEYGAHFVDGELIEFEFKVSSNVCIAGEESREYKGLERALIQLPNGEKRFIKFALCIIAGGSNSGKIGKLAHIGTEAGLLSIPLPLEERQRNKYIFSTSSQEVPAFSTPLTIDPSGCYFTREGLSGNYLCGTNMNNSNKQSIDTIQSGEEIFNAEIRPSLSQRVSSFKDAKVKKCWTETYEYNAYDDNGFIGTHPYYNNLYIAAGFNRHEIQQSAAVGRGISEIIIDGRYRTIDLGRLSFDRMVVDQPLYETVTF